MKVTVSACYTLTAAASVDLGDHTWDDVEHWYVKWDILHLQFKGDPTYHEFPLETDPDPDGIDWKRPSCVDIYEGDMEFDHQLAESF